MGFVTADMNLPLERLDVINLFAEDLAGTRSFYHEVLGLSLAFEDERAAVFKLENVMVCLSEVTGSAELIAPTAVAGPGAGARFVLTVFVDDVDAACIELARHGVVLLNGPVDRPWGCAPPASPTQPDISGRSLRISSGSARPVLVRSER